jgi:hypothetical protein
VLYCRERDEAGAAGWRGVGCCLSERVRGTGMKRTNRVAWGLAVVLAAVLVGGGGLLIVRLRPYLIARYWGRGANLMDAALPGAFLSGVDLREALLFGANLQGSHLAGTDLRNASLAGADLSHANLRGADLGGAFLFGGHWVRVLQSPPKRPLKLKPKQTDLRGADLRGANLQGARLNLEGVRLPGVLLTIARYDSRTRWPKGFDPVKAGAVLVR